MLKKVLLSWAVAAAMLIHGSSALCEEFVVFGNYNKAPKIYWEDDSPKGILIDILKYIEKHSAHSFDVQLYPWKRSYLKANLGEGGIIGLSKTTARLDIYDYSDVVYYDEIIMVVLKEDVFSYKSIEDLAGKRVGARRGSFYGDEFVEGQKSVFEVSEDGNALQRFNKLLKKRIDVALIGPGKLAFEQLFKDNPELEENRDKFAIIEKPFILDANYLAFSKSMNKKEFLSDFNQVLRQGKEDGTIQTIIDSYPHLFAKNE